MRQTAYGFICPIEIKLALVKSRGARIVIIEPPDLQIKRHDA